jgi:hypothetical protein
MKFPRWLLVSLLSASVLAVLGAGAWWWVTWPERTAREFLERLGDGGFVELERLFGWTPDQFHQDARTRNMLSAAVRSVPFEEYEPVARTPGDYLLARQRFEWRAGWGEFVDTIFVEKGEVKFHTARKPLTALEVETRAQNPTGPRPSRIKRRE